MGAWTRENKRISSIDKYVTPPNQNRTTVRSENDRILGCRCYFRKRENKNRSMHKKNTDKYQYLPATSCHPNSVKRVIPYGLGVRVKRICSSDKDYKARRNEIKTHLQNRGYRSSLIEEQLQKVDELNREDLLQYKDRKENDRVPLVFTYFKALRNIHAILRKHLKILHQSNRLKKIFSDPPIVSLKT